MIMRLSAIRNIADDPETTGPDAAAGTAPGFPGSAARPHRPIPLLSAVGFHAPIRSCGCNSIDIDRRIRTNHGAAFVYDDAVRRSHCFRSATIPIPAAG